MVLHLSLEDPLSVEWMKRSMPPQSNLGHSRSRPVLTFTQSLAKLLRIVLEFASSCDCHVVDKHERHLAPFLILLRIGVE